MSKDKEKTEDISEEKSAEESEEVSEETKDSSDVEEEVNSSEEIDWQDKYVRLHAEWDNYRKRMDEQRADERVRATERLMGDLLVCIDDLQRSIDYASNHGEGDLLDGVKAINQKFTELLSQHGLEEINPIDEPFDPLLAQAVGTVEDADRYDETVSQVLQKGYKLGIKVLRPAMVIYTTGGEKRPVEELVEEEKSDKEDEANTSGNLD
jgi:molecular chaperone GrpE